MRLLLAALIWLAAAGMAFAQAGVDFVPLLTRASITQVIAGISPTSCSGSAGSACASITVTLSPPTPPASTTQTVVASGQGCTGSTLFSFSGNVLNITAGTANGSYTVCDQVTAAGLATKVFAIAATVTSGVSTTIVNANNPTTPAGTVLTCGGNSFVQTTKVDPTNSVAIGGWHMTVNGVANDPNADGSFHVVCNGSTAYAWDVYGANSPSGLPDWYTWTGSWTSSGAAPPWMTGQTGVPFILGITCCSNPFNEYPFNSWFSRVLTTPHQLFDYVDNNSGNGIEAGFSPGSSIPNPVPFDVTYAMFAYGPDIGCTDAGPPGGGSVDASNASAIVPYYQGIANGTYDSIINTQISTYLVPIVSNGMYYIRLSHEWPGNFQCDSPWYNQPNTDTQIVPAATWRAAWIHVRCLLRAQLPTVKIEWDGPGQASETPYYPGDDNVSPGLDPVCTDGGPIVDIMGLDPYVGTFATDDPSATSALANAFQGPYTIDGANLSYLAMFAQQHNKPLVWPEWADASQYSNGLGGPLIITNMSNFMASLTLGPSGATFVANSYWDNATCTSATGCQLGKWPNMKAAYAQNWPNGMGNTHYTGSFWPTFYVMPASYWGW